MSRSEVEFPPGAVWIGSQHPFDLHEAYLCFRSGDGWELDRFPEIAVLDITADSRYKLWVNGRFVARGPARSYPQAQSVDRLNLLPYLQVGANLLAVQVYQPGYSHFAYLHRGAAGLLAHLICDGKTVLHTDTRWRVRRDPSFASQVPRVSIYSSGVEQQDLNRADDWTQIGYDDAAWSAARTVASVGAYPWTSLRLRELPLLNEKDVPLTLLQTRKGKALSSRQYDVHCAMRDGWAAAEQRPVPSDESDWFSVVLDSGESVYWLFDLGRDYSCQGWADVEGAAGEEQLRISYAEKIREGELVISDPDTYCRVRLTDHFHLRPGSQNAETFSFRGGRYLLFGLTGPTNPEFRIRFRARAAEYPLEITRELPTLEPRLAEIMSVCEETFKACLQDGFVDCTWRESSQWLGDALPQSLIMAALSDDTRPLRRVLEMSVQGAYPDGILPSVTPGEVHAYAVVDYNFIWVELLGLYKQLTDDIEFVADNWPTMLRMLDRFHQDLDEAGLLISQPGRRLFLDWAPLSRSEPNATYNLHYVLALQQASDLADELDPHNRQSGVWRSRASSIQTACLAAFWHRDRFYDDVQRSTFSQLANALAVLTGTAPKAETESLLDSIAARSLLLDDDAAPDRMVLASPFKHHYVFEALRYGGRSEQVIEIIRQRWGRWVEQGYPTVWENWDVDFPDGSQCHAFSAHPRYHLAEIVRENGRL